MALQAAYKQFLAAPNTSALAENASLHYVTTTTTVAGATDIIKHLTTVRNRINKKKEDALFAIENRNVLVFEAETALEFVTSGGPYLPGMDDNFLADRTVVLPIASAPPPVPAKQFQTRCAAVPLTSLPCRSTS